MPTYDVTSGPDNEVVLVMKAESPDTIPTSITGPDQSLVKYAKELVDDFEASAIAIASRMGWGAQLVPQDDDGGTSRLNAALEKARGKTTDVQKEAEVDVSAGDIIKTDMDKRLVFGWAPD